MRTEILMVMFYDSLIVLIFKFNTFITDEDECHRGNWR